MITRATKPTTDRRRRATRIVSGAAVLAVVAVIAGCSASDPVPTEAGITPTAGFGSDYVTPAPTVPAPLRGTLVPAGSLTGPSLAAKIDNHEEARPQIGLERTDIVFEELVEGGLTRYVAIWQSDVPDLIGPVRSIRPMDPDILSSFGGIVAFSGGQEQFVDMMRAAPVYSAIHGQADTDSTFYRMDGRTSPHDVVVKATELVAQHADLATPVQQFAYSWDVASSTAVTQGTATSAVDVVFSDERYPGWDWDAAAGVFLRTQEGGPDYDTNGDQLSAVNVVTLRVDEVYDYDAEVPQAVLVASGEATVSTGGRTVHATWVKDAPTAPIRLIDDLGATVRLAPGNTWIELVPEESGSVTVVPAA
ncbi:DUF3048 domain-containing protein [Herbiconiux solani]|uniref:DUF3048 domain-containing protein n=1 Tax=Herbiconiux solani TaxID=661329 RepID=UPI0014712E38|nr:DUF3048 domain-containing protein [Herbiconiux solani]